MTAAERFADMEVFYKKLLEVQSAVATVKGGIPLEKYVGRFFAADTLELLVKLGEKARVGADRLTDYKHKLDGERDLLTPNQKPIYEMTLDEFEKAMNIKK